MRQVVALLFITTLVFAWKAVVTVNYYNPSARAVLAPPMLKLRVVSEINPISNAIRVMNISINLGVNNTQISNLIVKRLNVTISKCTYPSTPLIRLVMCTIMALKDLIGINYLVPKAASGKTFVTLEGVMGYKYSADVSAGIVGKKFLGFITYNSYAYMRNFVERVYLSMASENGYLIVSGRAGAKGVPASYYKIVAPNATGILVFLSEPLAKPKLLVVGEDTLVLVQRPIISYSVIYTHGTLLPKAVWLYYAKPTSKILLPLKYMSLMTPTARSIQTIKLCRSYLTVALPGDHTVAIDTPSYKLSMKVKGFIETSIPIPCNDTFVLKVDKSTVMLNAAVVSGKTLVVYPLAPTLIPTLLQANTPFLIITQYGSITCPPTCFLLRPPTRMELDISDVYKTSVNKVTLPPVITYAKVQLSPNLPSRGCMVTLVSPVQTYIQVYTGKSTLASLTVGPKPLRIAVPCNRPITLKATSYTATLMPKNNEWIYICPINYGTQGTVLSINTTAMTPPLSVSCDGGLHWADINATQFLMIKPLMVSVHLTVIDKNGAKASLIVTRGVSKLNIFPIENFTGSKIRPFTGNDLIPVTIITKGFGNRTITLMFMKGNEYVEYAINRGRANVGIPRAWLNSKITLRIGEGVELHKVVLPPLETKIGKVQSVSPIYLLLWNRIPYNYHSFKLVITKGGNLAIATVSINGFKTIVKGSAVFVMPNNTAIVKIGNQEMVVPVNGQEVVAKLKAPTQLALSAPVLVYTLIEGKPETSRVIFSDGKNTVTYTVHGVSTILLPQEWLNKQLMVGIISKDVACETKIPPLLTAFISHNVTSPLVSILKSGAPNCYSLKLVLLRSPLVKTPASAEVILDGKYRLSVRGSVVIIYYKPEATITINNNTYKLLMDGGVAKLIIKKREIHHKPLKTTNITVEASLVTALKKAGRWNPVKELPALLSLSTAFVLSIGVLNSGVEPTSAWGSIAYALAAFNILVIVALMASILAMYFQTS